MEITFDVMMAGLKHSNQIEMEIGYLDEDGHVLVNQRNHIEDVKVDMDDPRGARLCLFAIHPRMFCSQIAIETIVSIWEKREQSKTYYLLKLLNPKYKCRLITTIYH